MLQFQFHYVSEKNNLLHTWERFQKMNRQNQKHRKLTFKELPKPVWPDSHLFGTGISVFCVPVRK